MSLASSFLTRPSFYLFLVAGVFSSCQAGSLTAPPAAAEASQVIQPSQAATSEIRTHESFSRSATEYRRERWRESFKSCQNKASDFDESSDPSKISIIDIEFTQGSRAVAGKVFDHKGQLLKDVTLSFRSLNESLPFSFSYLSADGTYDNICAPAGVQVEITASKPGYTTRKRIEVFKGSRSYPCLNCYDFGVSSEEKYSNFGVRYNALTPLPEVTSLQPKRNGRFAAFPKTFQLGFSKPVVRKSVENNFRIRHIPQDLSALPRTVVSPADVEFMWNPEGTEAVLTRKNSVNPENGKYAIELHSLKAQDGYIRSQSVFKLTDGRFEEKIFFFVGPEQP